MGAERSWLHVTTRAGYECGSSGWCGMVSKKLLEQGDAKAQSNLGQYYATAAGDNKDDIKAYAWSKLSAEKGEVTAQNFLNEWTKGLTPSQIEQGNRLAQQLRAATPASPKTAVPGH